MIVGAQKCGTTSLSQILSRHPSIICCSKKEPMFFSSADNWEQDISDYHALYPWKEGALHFEASTSYTCYPHQNLNIWEDLYSYNPDLKIIYIVRNPIDRIISSYVHSYERGYINVRNIEQAIIEEPILLDMTRYATQILPYIEQFGRDRVEIIFFQDFIKNRNSTIEKLCDFLEINSGDLSNTKNVHANKSMGNFRIHHKYDEPNFMLAPVKKSFPQLWKLITDNSARYFKKKPVLSSRFQEVILYLLRNEIDELEKITGRNLDSWREIKSAERTDQPNDYHYNWVEAKMNLVKRIKNKLYQTSHL